jgi:hypothetical protein
MLYGKDLIGLFRRSETLKWKLRLICGMKKVSPDLNSWGICTSQLKDEGQTE